MPSVEINGRKLDFDVADDTPLLWVLRDVAGLTGTKFGCGVALCGCCTVHLDGEPIRSCVTAIGDVAGRKITTIEGLSHGDEMHPVQVAFVRHDAMQCGFCTPGMVMSCAALLERNATPTLTEVKHAVSGNLCRCGTYPKVFAATLDAAKQRKTAVGLLTVDPAKEA
jgi:aerobic-type carbon monoxide dehydrogenase small subunit (CoxS/CutS family)